MIFAITGTIGAGKNEIVRYLVEQYGYKHYSFREYLSSLVLEKGLPLNRDSMRTIANELREQFGGGYIIDLFIQKAGQEGGNAVIESIRAPIEADYIASRKDTVLLAVDAPIEVRYERIQKRASSTDQVTFAEFKQQEDTEMQNEDPTKQNLHYCIGKTLPQFRLDNSGTPEELHKKIEAILNTL